MSAYAFQGPRPSYLFTSESVSEGHPDKVCDQISDAVLDLFLSKDPFARLACETLATTNRVVLAGEKRGPDVSDDELVDLVRGVVSRIGYCQEGFHWQNLNVVSHLHDQSSDIAAGVDATELKEEGAGDQGIMFGYACLETPQMMPAPIYFAHRILRRMAQDRRDGKRPEFGPDAKSQITLRYEDGVPVRASSVLVSTQHHPDASQSRIRELVFQYVQDVLPKGWMCDESELYVNPTGRFIIGGPDGDAGLTGRKIIVDTYGGAAPHGGGAFSGKDPTKVDRSAAYAARYLAKNVVAAGLARRCTIQLAYAIGISRPLALYVDLHGTGALPVHELERAIHKVMDLSPRGIREHLNLNKPIYEPTAAYGHFGRTPRDNGAFSWEKLDLVDSLTKSL